MKSVIVYYTHTGNTKKAAEILNGLLLGKGAVDVIRLNAKDESDSFFGQAGRAVRHKRAEIEAVEFDLAVYDLLCFGTPVWAFGPAPAMNTYLDECFGLEDKEVILFTTYGSGTGNGRCLKYMRDILNRKGAKQFKNFSIQQQKVKDKEFVVSQINEILI